MRVDTNDNGDTGMSSTTRFSKDHTANETATVQNSVASKSSSRMAEPCCLTQVQRDLGNQAVQQLFRSGHIQAQLAIRSPDDPEEREPDNVAHTIMLKHAGARCSCSEDEEMCEECQQRQSAPTIQRHASTPSTPSQVPRIVSDVLRSPGQPLDAYTRAFFEPRFGHDFSHVRVHTGGEAAASARSINANAYTLGSDIVFGAGQYAPDTPVGDALLAHELVHTIQRSPFYPQLKRQPVHATLMTPDEIAQLGISSKESLNPRGQTLTLPTQFNELVNVVDEDTQQTRRVTAGSVRESPDYVDNAVVSVGAELDDFWTLSIKYLVFKLRDGRLFNVRPDDITLASSARVDQFVRRSGIVFPSRDDRSIAFDPANTPNICRGAMIKLDQQLRGRADRRVAAQVTFAFQLDLAGLASAAYGLPEASLPAASLAAAERGAAAPVNATIAYEDVDRVLMELRDAATDLTRRTSASGAPFTATKFGSVNDAVFKSLVKQAIEEGRLPPTIRTSPSSMNVPGSGGIDVWDTATGRGWDLTTARSEQVLGHDVRYLNRTAPDGTLIIDVTPLVYSR